MNRDRIRRSHRFSMTPEHLTLDPRVDDRAHRMWCRIDRLGEGAKTVPSVREELSIELDCSLASVDRAIRQLVAAGWLQVERQPGGESLYTLVVVPEKAVAKLIEEARAEREARWAGKRRAYIENTAARPPEERRRGRRTEASPQVSASGVVTHDDTVSSPMTTGGGVVTDDDGVSSPETTGVVMGDDRSFYREVEKNQTPLPPADAGREEAAADAATKGDDDDPDALFEPPPPASSGRRTGRARPARATRETDPNVEAARRLCAAWWEALPIKPSGSKTFLGVVTLVAADLAAGRTEDEISKALRECGVAVTRNALNFRYQRAQEATTPATTGPRAQGYLADPRAEFFAPARHDRSA